MKNTSTGFGLCVLGLGIAAWPVLDRLAPSANASAVTAAASAVSTAATAQPGPTIVWYGTDSLSYGVDGFSYSITIVTRAWSTGRVESKWFRKTIRTSGGTDTLCQPGINCASEWIVINDPAQGLTYRSDINFDEKVDGADLGQLLVDWGNAPRQDIPPSDCPLALINP